MAGNDFLRRKAVTFFEKKVTKKTFALGALDRDPKPPGSESF
jgi:hypothetical protein